MPNALRKKATSQVGSVCEARRMQIAMSPKPNVLASISRAARSWVFKAARRSPAAADDPWLGFDGDAETILHGGRDPPGQSKQLRPGGVAMVDQHQRMRVGHA